ncbi:LuxR family two component transcriptional regulator [Pseudoxanthomonas sp. 3HH-4]|nr:LuxR family two component transcriptional regulator [Pseudoxanthomonas sp. 3HH-4]
MESCKAVIHVVDDDDSLREAVSRLLSMMGFEVRQYPSAGDFLLAWPTGEPGCVLLDVCMPGPSGLELQLALSKHPDSLPVVFLTGNGDIPMSVLAIRRGAVDFLTKPFDREQLLAAIIAALQQDSESSEKKQRRQEVRRRFDTLTPRERVVFSQVISGRLNKQIADTLGTCERTVKAHRAHVMEKMQVHSVAGLVHLSLDLPETMAGGSSPMPQVAEAAA